MKTSCRQTELRNLNCRKVPYWLSKVVVAMLVLKMRRNSWIQPVSMYISLQINFSLSVVGALSTIIRYAPAPIFEYVFENLCSYLSFHGVHNDWWLVSLVIWNRFLDCLCQLLLFPSFTRWPPQPVAVAWQKTFWYEENHQHQLFAACTTSMETDG